VRLSVVLALGAAALSNVTAAPAREPPAGASSAHAALALAEREYADWLDATSAVSTIDSGLMPRVDGRNRAQWDTRRRRLQTRLAIDLESVDKSRLRDEDARALTAMRDGLVVNALEASQSAPGADAAPGCADRNRAETSDPAPLELALYACFDEIGDHIVFDRTTVVRTTALQWLQEIDDPGKRKQLFFAFTPLWEAVNGQNDAASPYRRMIALAAEQGRRTGNSALGAAAASLHLSGEQVEQWLTEILKAWRSHLRAPAIEPWDYWYSAAAASRQLLPAIPLKAVLPISERFYRDLGADLPGLGVIHDLDVRPGKAPLAYTDQVRIGRRTDGGWRPAVPRVSANYERGGLSVLNELIHEDGHAVHEAALRTRPAFYSLGGDLFDEAFADVPAWSSFEPAWQRKYLGHSAPTAASLEELFSNVMLDVAWSLFEISMLREPTADPNAVWSRLASRYLNVVPHPEIAWWALRAQLVRWPGYMVNYGLGAVLTADIRQRISSEIGPFDTGNRRWYGWTSAWLLRYGSSLDPATLLPRFLGRSVAPDALLSQLRRLDSPPDAR
jgi:Peptidase family M3